MAQATAWSDQNKRIQIRCCIHVRAYGIIHYFHFLYFYLSGFLIRICTNGIAPLWEGRGEWTRLEMFLVTSWTCLSVLNIHMHAYTAKRRQIWKADRRKPAWSMRPSMEPEPKLLVPTEFFSPHGPWWLSVKGNTVQAR